ncbi:hypothetical protein [Sphaerobacter thermophilus]|jgi:hypothetical protein|uniref:hypothetical protein n=1 Tax=Sphaerobacter thermophilus TaxID=2057 RepID=UPI000DB60FE1|nr:MAG: hypothetical protein DIU58_11310 [Sphaerobacter thermophilus]
MQEERQPRDPTRKMLRVFGVKVTQYEERTAALLEQIAAAPADRPEDLLRLAAEVVDLTADMNHHLREMVGHVLNTQQRVLTDLRAAIERAQE